MSYGFRVKVWGDYACFTRPELKVERVSYDFMTPSAAKGVLDSIYWKPAITWIVDKIHVINPIQFTNIRRNEVSGVCKLSGVKKAAEKSECYELSSTDLRHQRAAMVLKNVVYVIEAHFEMNAQKSGETDTPEKHYNIALRRLRQGQYFQKPFLGTREFSASFEIIEKDEALPKSSLHGERDFGYMLHGLNYATNEKCDQIEVNPSFFRAVTTDGICYLSGVSGVVS